MVNSQFCSDEEFNEWIQEGAQELLDILVEANEDYNTTSSLFTIAPGANSTNCPVDLYKLRLIEKSISGKWVTVERWEFEERGLFTDRVEERFTAQEVRYHLISDSIHFLPEENAPGDYRLWYLPELAVLDDDADTFNGRNGWDAYIVFYAAIEALRKEESDIGDIEKKFQKLEARIRRLATRDHGRPRRIARTRNYYYEDVP